MKRWMLYAGFALAVAALAACGGGDGGNKQLCIDTCEKTNECNEMDNDCQMACSGNGNGGGECNNQGEIADHFDMCNAGECGENGETYTECLNNAPQCEM